MMFTVMSIIRTKTKEKKINLLDDMIADIMTNKKFQAISKEIFTRCRKLNISLVFTTQCYFRVPKDVRLNFTHYLIMKIHNRKELQQTAIDHPVDIENKDFLKIYRDCTKEPYSFFTIDVNGLMKFSKNFSDSPL